MLIPLNCLGALETICADAIIGKMPWIAACLNSYLSCGEIGALNWRPEKRDKARLQCLVAALNEDDPNKGLQYLFHVDPPVIPMESEVFLPIVDMIKRFRDEATTDI
jgi:hypothetical protein